MVSSYGDILKKPNLNEIQTFLNTALRKLVGKFPKLCHEQHYKF